MKKRFRTFATLVLVGTFVVCASACGSQSGGTADSEPLVKTEPAKAPSDKGDQIVTGGDLEFMNAASQGGMVEVSLGLLATMQGSSKEVKQFAEQMMTDHTKAGDELKQLAEGKKVTLPPDVSPTHKEITAKLSKLKGAEFDRAYVKAMVEDHEKDVTAFDATAKTAADADVKAYAAKTLPTLRMHLQMIRDIQAKMK